MEDVQVLSQEEVDVELTHDQEVKDLFEKVTVVIPNSGGLRAISLTGFQVAIELMMNKAFYQGARNSIVTVEDMMDKIYNRYK
jgi:hypothetical protein